MNHCGGATERKSSIFQFCLLRETRTYTRVGRKKLGSGANRRVHTNVYTIPSTQTAGDIARARVDIHCRLSYLGSLIAALGARGAIARKNALALGFHVLSPDLCPSSRLLPLSDAKSIRASVSMYVCLFYAAAAGGLSPAACTFVTPSLCRPAS